MTQIRFWIILAVDVFCCLTMKEMFPPTMCDDGLDDIDVFYLRKWEIETFLFLPHFHIVMRKISVVGSGMWDSFCSEKIHNFRATIIDKKLLTLQEACDIWSKQVKQQYRLVWDWVAIQSLGLEGKQPLVSLCLCRWVQDLANTTAVSLVSQQGNFFI